MFGPVNNNISSPDSCFIASTVSSSNPNNLNSASILVYPNPATGNLNITGITPKLSELFDVTGKRLRTFEAQEQITVFGLPAGLYFLHVLGNNQTRGTVRVLVR